MYSHILVAVDGSDNAFRAAQEAMKIAKLSKSTMVDIVYVVNVEKVKNELLRAGSPETMELARQRKIAPVEQALRAKTNSLSNNDFKRRTGVRNCALCQ